MRCAISGESYEIPALGHEICAKLQVPLPLMAMGPSLQRKLAWRNFIHLYKGKCAKSGRSIITNIPPSSGWTVYDKEIWFSDSWDPLDYGRPFDFSRSFFAQFGELAKTVPIDNLMNVNTENSDYCYSASDVKNCYLSFVVYYRCEDIYYSFWVLESRDVCYSLFAEKCELAVYCKFCQGCYQVLACEECRHCRDCAFCFACESCQNCLFCSNLYRKEYCVFNKQLSRNDYNKFKQTLDLGSLQKLRECLKRVAAVKQAAVHRCGYILNCEECSGNHLADSKNCNNCFEVTDCENILDSVSGGSCHSLYRSYGFGHSELGYEAMATENVSQSSFILSGWNSFDCHYSMNLHNCQHCFGCAGLRNKQYCLLNKQYTPVEYEALKAKVIAHMQQTPLADPAFTQPVMEYGQFFPPLYSPIPYNVSHAADFWPLSEAEARRQGYLWDAAAEPPGPAGEANFKPPDHIKDWDTDKEGQLLHCERSGKLFSITPRVLQMLKKLNITPLPEQPLEYIKRRLREQSYILRERKSYKSGELLQTIYSEQAAPKVVTNEEYRNLFFS